MSVDTERLRGLDSHKLVDVVRNYRQYGYPPAMRDSALGILRDRGHDIAHLETTGAFSNHDFIRAEALYASFKSSTLFALLCYLLALGLLISSGLELSEPVGTLLSVGRWIAQAAALVFVIRSYLLQASFYTTIGKKDEEESPLAYILLGIPLYIVLFFWSRARMREEMVMIR